MTRARAAARIAAALRGLVGATDRPMPGPAGARGLLIAVPLYRAPELVPDLARALANAGREMAALDATIILLNDSPDDEGLRAALDAHLPTLRRAARVEVIENPRNLGFVATANAALAMGLDRGVDVLLLNSDALLTPGALTEMAAVAYSDPLIGFVSPRSDNATICTSPVTGMFFGLGREGARAAHEAIRHRLPRLTYVPTAVGFCLYVKAGILRSVGLLDPIYGRGYNEENDLVMRANRKGYRAALANHAFVHHMGTVSFGQSQVKAAELEDRNRPILLARYPHYDRAVRRYFEGAGFHAERLLAGLVPDVAGRLGVLFDARGLDMVSDPEAGEYACGLIAAFATRFGREFRTWVTGEAAFVVHLGLDRLEGVEVVAPEAVEAGAFAVAIGLADPSRPANLPGLGQVAPLNGHLIQPAAVLDRLHLDDDDIETSWRWMAETSALIGFTSRFALDRFNRRFGQGGAGMWFVAACSADIRDYAAAEQPGGADHVLLIGDRLGETAAAIRRVTDDRLVLPAREPSAAADATLPPGPAFENAADLLDRAAIVVLSSPDEANLVFAMQALARGKVVIAHDLAPFHELRARCPEAVNLHLFPCDEAIAEAVAAGIGWRSAPPGKTPRSWSDTAADLRDAIRAAMDRLDYEQIRSRIRALRAIGG